MARCVVTPLAEPILGPDTAFQIDLVEAEVIDWREALNRSDREILALRARLNSATEAEARLQYQIALVRLAAIGDASALATTPGDTGHSGALVAVVRLRELAFGKPSNVLGGGAGI